MPRVMRSDVDPTAVSVNPDEMMPQAFAWYRTALLRLASDDSGQALVEYCLVMATLTILMMAAFRNVGSVANSAAGNSVNAMTNSSVVVP